MLSVSARTGRRCLTLCVVRFCPDRKALSDPLPEVRAAAAQTFDSLHNTVGTRALDEILPPLMEQLSQPDQVGAVDGTGRTG